MKKLFFAVAIVAIVAMSTGQKVQASEVYLPIVNASSAVEYDDLTYTQVAAAFDYLLSTAQEGDYMNDSLCDVDSTQCVNAASADALNALMAEFSTDSVEFDMLVKYGMTIHKYTEGKSKLRIAIQIDKYAIRSDFTRVKIDGKYQTLPLAPESVAQIFNAFDRAIYNGDCYDYMRDDAHPTLTQTTTFVVGFVCNSMYAED